MVRQFQKVKPYTGQTSHESFKEHFERVAKANAWVTEKERMQNLALALEGPALECLREIKEDESGAYERLWKVLARRFGYLDEPERAMRRFDARKQLDGESVAEYEQALRTFYREAWPQTDETTKNAALKRRFEEGVSSPDMLQFLRLHARQDNFLQTVAKARRFAEAQEAAKPKKSVRIIEDKEKNHSDEVTRSGQPDFQPLIDGFGKVLQTVFNQNQPAAMVTVGVRDESVSSAEGKFPNPPRKSRRDQTKSEQQPQQGGKSGMDRPRGNTPEREGRRNGNSNAGNENRNFRRDGSVSPGRDDYRPSGTRFNRPNARGNGNGNGYYRSSSADSYRSRASTSGQRPGNWSPSPRSRYSDESNRRSFQPSGMARSYQPRSWYGRTFYGSTNPRSQNGTGPQESRSPRPPGGEINRPITPPPQWGRRCHKCGMVGCHSELHYGFPRRNTGRGCFVCGRFGCHSFFHAEQGQGQRNTVAPQTVGNSENGQRGPSQGSRSAQQLQSGPSSQ